MTEVIAQEVLWVITGLVGTVWSALEWWDHRKVLDAYDAYGLHDLAGRAAVVQKGRRHAVRFFTFAAFLLIGVAPLLGVSLDQWSGVRLTGWVLVAGFALLVLNVALDTVGRRKVEEYLKNGDIT